MEIKRKPSRGAVFATSVPGTRTAAPGCGLPAPGPRYPAPQPLGHRPPVSFTSSEPNLSVLDISEVDFEFDVQLDIDLGLTRLVLT